MRSEGAPLPRWTTARGQTEPHDPGKTAASASVGLGELHERENATGPLDWLLEMAQARKIDLARLSIVAYQLGVPLLLARSLQGEDRLPDGDPFVARVIEVAIDPLAVPSILEMALLVGNSDGPRAEGAEAFSPGMPDARIGDPIRPG